MNPRTKRTKRTKAPYILGNSVFSIKYTPLVRLGAEPEFGI